MGKARVHSLMVHLLAWMWDERHNKEVGMSEVIEMMQTVGDHHYNATDGSKAIAREYGVSPNGNPYKGAWVLREFNTGKYLDHDYNRHDLFERNKIKILEL
ncbi:hypothetical protein D3C71_1532450 [compost metagenome]